jgi:hypothetical protein
MDLSLTCKGSDPETEGGVWSAENALGATFYRTATGQCRIEDGRGAVSILVRKCRGQGEMEGDLSCKGS